MDLFVQQRYLRAAAPHSTPCYVFSLVLLLRFRSRRDGDTGSPLKPPRPSKQGQISLITRICCLSQSFQYMKFTPGGKKYNCMIVVDLLWT